MKKMFRTLGAGLLLLLPFEMQAQDWSSPEAEQIYEQGMQRLGQGNASEAVAILQKIAPAETGNLKVKKSLAQAYQLSGDNENALVVLSPVISGSQADPEVYRIAAMAQNGLNDSKKALKTLASGIERFPNSGLLYYEQGVMLKNERRFDEALRSWLEGISRDPEFRLNYHEAAIAYVQTDQPVWAILYGEIFVNKEPNTPRGNETRILLLDAYQKFFFTPSKMAGGNPLLGREPNNFQEAVEKSLLSLFFVVSDGINTENLTMLRTRFIVSWTDNYASKYPYSLFSFQENLIRNGYFDAYNQWLLGKAENPQQFAGWEGNFSKELKELERFKAQNPLKMAISDNYNLQRNFKGLFKVDTKSKK